MACIPFALAPFKGSAYPVSHNPTPLNPAIDQARGCKPWVSESSTMALSENTRFLSWQPLTHQPWIQNPALCLLIKNVLSNVSCPSIHMGPPGWAALSAMPKGGLANTLFLRSSGHFTQGHHLPKAPRCHGGSLNWTQKGHQLTA